MMTFEYHEGYRARLAGESNCPYQVDSQQWALWCLGWQDCNDQQ